LRALVDSVAYLADVLLGPCPRLRVLATRREPLGVWGEAVWTYNRSETMGKGR